MTDGRFDDWPEGRFTAADEAYIYFRFALPEERSLQNSDRAVALWLDADADPATGVRMGRPSEAAPMGVDVEVIFSPTPGMGTEHPGRGAIVRLHGAGGQEITLRPAEADLAYGPTHASSRFEVRLSRHAGAAAGGRRGLAATPLTVGGPAVSMFVMVDPADDPEGWSDPEIVEFPPASPEPAGADVAVPPKEPGTLRLVSYNVWRSAPMSRPGPFEHILTVLDPDIVLVQEWEAENAGIYSAWFSALVPSERGWNAVGGPGGVAIVSRFPVRPLGPGAETISAASDERPPRFASGLVETPLGDVVAGSVHLKCCGALGSPEDERRLAEAAAINESLRRALGGGAPAVRIVAGDMNLVGSREPLERLGAGLAADGDLRPASALVLGDASQYTWTDPASEFPASRLDYVLVGGADVVRAFVLDTARLSDEALAAMGLDRDHSAASDHRPVVVDLRPR